MGEMVQGSASRLNFCQVRLVRSRIWYPRRKMKKKRPWEKGLPLKTGMEREETKWIKKERMMNKRLIRGLVGVIIGLELGW